MIEIEKYARAAASTARTPPNSPARRAALEAENTARVAAEQFVKGLQAQLASVPLAGTKAAIDVSAERRRQVDAEGYDHQHDDAHVGSEIAAAACFYAMPPGAREWDTSSTGYGGTLGDAIVPDGWVLSAGSRRRDLVKAGALILAEIERMDRAAAIKAGREVPGARLAVGERLHIG